MLDKKAIGKRVAEVRRNLHLKQESFAEPLGITRSALSLIEGGQGLSIQVADKIVKNYGVSFEYLLHGGASSYSVSSWVSTVHESRESYGDRDREKRGSILELENHYLQEQIRALKQQIEDLRKHIEAQNELIEELRKSQS